MRQPTLPKSPVVGIVVKPRIENAESMVREIVDWLSKKELPVVLGSDIAEEIDTSNFRDMRTASREQMSDSCDVLVVCGGDGTLISASRFPSKRSPVIIGVNMGTLGFLTEITKDELFTTLETVLAGNAEIEERSMLEVSIFRDKKCERTFSALNDAVITKHAIARIFSVELRVDGVFAAAVRGDGLIVATPGGSTAYSMAAGGSIVHPQVEAMLVTPICPHSLTSRPLVIPGTASVELRVSTQHSERDGDVYFTVDGQEGMELGAEQQIRISTSPHRVRFVKSPTRNYFDVLGTKLKWSNN